MIPPQLFSPVCLISMQRLVKDCVVKLLKTLSPPSEERQATGRQKRSSVHQQQTVYLHNTYLKTAISLRQLSFPHTPDTEKKNRAKKNTRTQTASIPPEKERFGPFSCQAKRKAVKNLVKHLRRGVLIGLLFPSNFFIG